MSKSQLIREAVLSRLRQRHQRLTQLMRPSSHVPERATDQSDLSSLVNAAPPPVQLEEPRA